METRHTTTFATLEIDPRAFEDIKTRLKEAGVLWDYVDIQDDRERIIFGTVALIEEPGCCALCRLQGATKEMQRAVGLCRSLGASWIAILREMLRAGQKKE